jgi:RNA polymerase sigma-70 factor (sigma-E family)
MELDDFVRDELQDLLRFARVLIGDRATAEDIVQDVVVKLFVTPRRAANISHIRPYARRMVVNEYLSWGRRWFRVQPTDHPPDTGVPGADPLSQLDDRDELRRRLLALPPRQRAVLTLRYFADLSDEQIATTLGCSTGTVRSHASRALADLRIKAASEAADDMEATR